MIISEIHVYSFISIHTCISQLGGLTISFLVILINLKMKSKTRKSVSKCTQMYSLTHILVVTLMKGQHFWKDSTTGQCK